MSRRLVLSALAGAVVLGGGAAATVALVGTADAAGPTGDPVIAKSSSDPVVLGSGGTHAFTFTTSVSDDSGIRSVKVLAWPRSSHLAPKASEMAHVESATCKASSATTSVCAYRSQVDGKDAADLPTGTWYVAVLVTAKDHGAAFSAKASTFTVTRHAG
ncbi:DUF5707 domain-containing protein [Streptomyces sp. NPDC057950]|uniref:DUF5707 domain-containing protein n=1 Tax=Streptomyces sp. NPDC057950 TaxID=3346288 RepID=UPI0036ECE4AF